MNVLDVKIGHKENVDLPHRLDLHSKGDHSKCIV